MSYNGIVRSPSVPSLTPDSHSGARPLARLKAFTLIELMIVIAIIAILAAILFPVFAKARDKARQASCTSNMKQFALAWMMYTQDYDETVMPIRWGTGATQYFQTRPLLDPYIKNTSVYICPSNNQTDQPNMSLTYTYNWCVGTTCGGGNDHPLSQFALPAQVPAWAESNNTAYTTVSYFFAMVNTTTFWGRRSEPTANKLQFWGGATPKLIAHNDGGNLIFTDGHVKWYHYQPYTVDTNSYNTDKAWYKGTTNQPGPPRENLDWDADGIVGTSTGYD